MAEFMVLKGRDCCITEALVTVGWVNDALMLALDL